ncbi:hypothetical protein OT109_19500 [Phycisphaeraceae bacterium D3-23]
MSWFQKFCRNTGLMIHGITQPVKDDAKGKPTKKVVKHEVEEEQLEGNVTLRRTTIEELEYKPGAKKPEDRSQETEDPE